MKVIDYLVVGSGLTGATIARHLADAGRDVVVVERRTHLGGNLHDHTHPSGIRIHTYGPHYFRTKSDKIWKFVNRFAEWFPFTAVLKSRIDNKLENWPISGSYVKQTCTLDWQSSFTSIPRNFEEANFAIMPKIIYQNFVKGYTEKQWGVTATKLSADLVKRFNVAWNDDPRLSQSKYQALPVKGYSDFMSRMLEGIPVILNCDFLKHQDIFNVRYSTIYTGPIDLFFDYKFGKLQYRSQKREHLYFKNIDYYQAYGQVNEPSQKVKYIRTLEWKHMMPPEYQSRIKGTIITRETPFTPSISDQYEYPFPSQTNRTIYKNYRKLADSIDDLIICGRLGEYRYYDMDHAIGRAMAIAENILQKPQSICA